MAQSGADGVEASVPFARTPHDTLRDGLPSHKHDAVPEHPLARAQPEGDTSTRRERIASTYGQAALARQDLDEQLLGMPLRPPGLAVGASRLGREVVTNEIDQLSYPDFLGVPRDAETAPLATVHERMEARLGLRQPSALPRRPGL